MVDIITEVNVATRIDAHRKTALQIQRDYFIKDQLELLKLSILFEGQDYYENNLNGVVNNISLGGTMIMSFNALTKAYANNSIIADKVLKNSEH